MPTRLRRASLARTGGDCKESTARPARLKVSCEIAGNLPENRWSGGWARAKLPGIPSEPAGRNNPCHRCQPRTMPVSRWTAAGCSAWASARSPRRPPARWSAVRPRRPARPCTAGRGRRGSPCSATRRSTWIFLSGPRGCAGCTSRSPRRTRRSSATSETSSNMARWPSTTPIWAPSRRRCGPGSGTCRATTTGGGTAPPANGTDRCSGRPGTRSTSTACTSSRWTRATCSRSRAGSASPASSG